MELAQIYYECRDYSEGMLYRDRNRDIGYMVFFFLRTIHKLPQELHDNEILLRYKCALKYFNEDEDLFNTDLW